MKVLAKCTKSHYTPDFSVSELSSNSREHICFVKFQTNKSLSVDVLTRLLARFIKRPMDKIITKNDRKYLENMKNPRK